MNELEKIYERLTKIETDLARLDERWRGLHRLIGGIGAALAGLLGLDIYTH